MYMKELGIGLDNIIRGQNEREGLQKRCFRCY